MILNPTRNGNALTVAESKTLAEHEATIERGLKTFYEVGAALAAIRDAKLYRQTHGTFEGYCNERWDFARSTAYQLIDASNVLKNVRNCGQTETLPANEAQARPLASVPEEERAEVWQTVVDSAPTDDDGNPRITAKHVQSVVDYEYEQPIKKKKTPVARMTINDLNLMLARPWGIEERYGSVEEMFNSELWQNEENQADIPEYIATVETVCRVFRELHRDCQTYAEKYGLEV